MTVRDPAASLAGCRLSPAVLRLQPLAARFLTRSPVPSAGSSAGVAWLEAEPKAARLPSPALQKAPPARAVRKTEGPMDGQGKGECRGFAKARGGEARCEARCGAVRP